MVEEQEKFEKTKLRIERVEELANVADGIFVEYAYLENNGIPAAVRELNAMESDASIVNDALLKSLYGQHTTLNLNGFISLFR